MNADPRCTCPHDGPFAVARDASCPVHGVAPLVVTDSKQPNGECLHTEVRTVGYGWHCAKCGQPVEM